MKIVQEQIDGEAYLDLILTREDLETIKEGETLSEFFFVKTRNITFGIRLITPEEERDANEEWE